MAGISELMASNDPMATPVMSLGPPPPQVSSTSDDHSYHQQQQLAAGAAREAVAGADGSAGVHRSDGGFGGNSNFHDPREVYAGGAPPPAPAYDPPAAARRPAASSPLAGLVPNLHTLLPNFGADALAGGLAMHHKVVLTVGLCAFVVLLPNVQQIIVKQLPLIGSNGTLLVLTNAAIIAVLFNFARNYVQ